MAQQAVLFVILAAVGGTFAQALPTTDCAKAAILAQGIALNIQDQKQEQAALAEVNQTLQAKPVDMAKFQAAKTDLFSFVNNGIAIREMNQLITPAGNKATAGIAIVANAQLNELNLTQNLTGNAATDAPLITMLNTGFTGGVQQNMKNMQDAMAGCPKGAEGPGAGTANGTEPKS